MLLLPVARTAHSSLRRPLDRWVDDTLAQMLSMDVPAEARQPVLDVTETDAGYAVQLEMPGVKKDAVKIAIEGRRVRIDASVPAFAAQEGERVLHRERSQVAFARSFTLPQEVDQTASAATLEDGVLKLTLAKRAAPQVNTLVVN